MGQTISERNKRNGCKCGMTRPGFSLIELLVAIALMGVVAAIVIPNLQRRGPKQKREQFVVRLNLLAAFARQQAIVSNKIQRIEFDLSSKRKRVALTQATGKKDDRGKPLFLPVKRAYIKTTVAIPASFSFKQFFIEGYDEIARHRVGKKTTSIWFFIVPDGLSQSVVINFVNTKEKIAPGKFKSVGLVLNPFMVQFKAYDTFQKP